VANSKLLESLTTFLEVKDPLVARVLPGREKVRMDMVPVCSNKVKLMLERGLNADIPDQFECLMEQFSVDEDQIVVRKLAENIRMIGSSGDTHAEDLPVSSIATLPQDCLCRDH